MKLKEMERESAALKSRVEELEKALEPALGSLEECLPVLKEHLVFGAPIENCEGAINAIRQSLSTVQKKGEA